ncbi:GyrI-like domain-containing protein [Cytobacillus sp. FJAT-53684]|uniref:GyrI-like domain-containing protein n=1 Tax=Cytobacillus mangrovibacter TaxID=3299024 RepID=A0ABW6JVZ1_9BACI
MKRVIPSLIILFFIVLIITMYVGIISCFWVSVEVKEYEDIPMDMVTQTIPPQRYAVLRRIGANSKIVEAYNDLHKWIEDNNFVRIKINGI